MAIKHHNTSEFIKRGTNFPNSLNPNFVQSHMQHTKSQLKVLI